MRFDEPEGPYHYPGSYWNNPNGMDALHEPHHIYLMHILIGHRGFFLLTPILLFGLVGMGRHFRQVGLKIAFLATVILLGLAGAVIADMLKDGQITRPIEQAIARFAPGEAIYMPRSYALLTPLVLLLLVNIGMYLPNLAKPRPMLAMMTLLISIVVLAFYSMHTNNYGGGAQGARWLFWLIPLWILMLPAALDWIAERRSGRVLFYSLFLVSMFSVAFAFREPWGGSLSWAHLLFRNLGMISY